MGNTEQFNQMAERYDSSERKRVAKISAHVIAELISNKSEKTAMDFGCGTGLVGLELMEEFQSILFVDSSENMIQQLNKKLSTVDNSNTRTLWVDLEGDNVPEVKVDVIFLSHVLLHIKDTQDIIQKLWKMLHAEGQLVLVDFDKMRRSTQTLCTMGLCKKN